MGIKAAYDRLATLRDTSDVTTPLQSLAFGWFIPRALTVEHQSLKLQECLDEECLDTKQPDTRIQKILRFYGNVETM